MSKRRPLCVLALPVLLGCSAASSAPAAARTRVNTDVDAMASAAVVQRKVPGLSVVILEGPDVSFAKGYGVQDVTGSGVVTPDTVFQLGSIGKQFLAALVLRLAEQGRLSLDDPVSRHMAELQQLPPGLQVRHLLTHTSGIREPFTMPEYQAGIEDLNRPSSEYGAILRAAPVDFPPGSRWSYSNANYQILALIVERITGTPYEQAMTSELFRPLGLPSLRQCTPLPAEPREARGHVLRDGRVTVAAPENMNWIRGDGGLCGNALDLARWLRLLATGQVLTAASTRSMIAPTRIDDGSTVDYGFGLSLVPLDGHRKVAHNGAMLGFSATAAYYPEADRTVVVLTNRGNVRTEAIERGLARRVLDLPAPDYRAKAIAPPEMTRYAGTYDIGVFSVRVVERDGQLWLETPPPGPTTALRYVGQRTFVDDTDPDASSIQFTGTDERIDGMRLFMGAMHWYGKAQH